MPTMANGESRHDWEERITAALVDQGEMVEWPGNRESGFFYRPGEVILERSAYDEDRARQVLNELGAGDPLPIQRITVNRPFRLDLGRQEVALRFKVTVPDEELPPRVWQYAETGLPLDLNYILAPGQKPKWHPGDDPEYGPVLAPVPHADRRAGEGVTVGVIDTGLHLAATGTELLNGVDGEPDWLYESASTPDSQPPTGFLLEAGGHGTFVAGLIRRVAPAARVVVLNAGTRQGIADIGLLIAKVTQAVRLGCDVINISLGTYTYQDRPLVAFDAAMTQLRAEVGRDVVVVASAGNDGLERPGWPAASDRVIGVAAVDWDGELCSFSNRGPWVKAASYGEKLWSVFVPGVENPALDPDGRHERWRGHQQWAEWSGTSFATPLVAGAIAARAGSGTTVAEAADALLAESAPVATTGGRGMHAPHVRPTFQYA